MTARSGTVLIAVLVITLLAGMLAATAMFRMSAEVKASSGGRDGRQAYAAAMSGIQRAIGLLRAYRDDPTVWYDDPDLFCDQFVYDDGANRWYFTIYAPNPIETDIVRYGLSDEAAKININTASREVLLALPNMTESLADCLMDYLDDDDDPQVDGAEQDYYDQLPQPYRIKNGPLHTLEELLLVKGFNGPVVYGEDANFNGLLDANENDGEESFPPDNGDGQLDMGLRGMATAISFEPDVDNAGEARININGAQDELNKLDGSGLARRTINFIKAYRADGQTFNHPSELLGMRFQPRSSPRSGRGRRGRRRGRGQTQQMESGVGPEELPALLDKLTVSGSAAAEDESEDTEFEDVIEDEAPRGARGQARGGSQGMLVGLVNVNTAPAAVLALMPGVGEDLAEAIVRERDAVDPEDKTTIAWLVQRDLVDTERFKRIAPYLTARSFQFRILCVGYGSPSGRFRVLEAVVDLTGTSPRVSYIRDITRLGLPFALEPQDREL